MIETSANITNIAKAILEFQGLVDGVKKDSKNPAFKSQYASLESVVDTAKPALQKVGVMFTQSSGEIIDGVMAMTTLLIHAESGEWFRLTMQLPLAKRDPQGVGSAQTYAMRYSLMAALGLPPTDDDGEGAIDRNNARPEPVRKPVAPVENKRVGVLLAQIAEANTLRGLNIFKDDSKADMDAMNDDDFNKVSSAYKARKAELGGSDTVKDIQDQFGGTVTNETLRNHPLNAG